VLDLRRVQEGRVASIVNLNKFRKAKKRAEDRQSAAQNLASHSRSKLERSVETAESSISSRELDGKKLD
jgi:hypothetical protein